MVIKGCFHKFANHQRVVNDVWDVENELGVVVSSRRELAQVARIHFRHIFNDPKTSIIESHLKLLEVFPRLAMEDDNSRMGCAITLEEIEIVLKVRAKDKSSGPDGWTVEFFIGFWDLVGPEILALVEESRRTGHISGALNTTFIALIPKVSKTTSYNDFRPISLCNFLYKIVSKIIAERMKPWLSRVIS